jgi:hypothetical protein
VFANFSLIKSLYSGCNRHFSDIMKFKWSVFAATGRIVRSNGDDCMELVRPVALNMFKFCSEGPEFALH